MSAAEVRALCLSWQRENPDQVMTAAEWAARTLAAMDSPARSRIYQRSQTLPSSLADRLRALHQEKAYPELDALVYLLHEAGWTLESVAQALGMTREGARQRKVRADPAQIAAMPAVEAPPLKPVKVSLVKPYMRAKPRIARHLVARMRELSEYARTVNGSTPADDPRRAASDELVQIMVDLLAQGFTEYAIAKALGVTVRAVHHRLASRGLATHPPSQRGHVYKGRPGRRGRRPATDRVAS